MKLVSVDGKLFENIVAAMVNEMVQNVESSVDNRDGHKRDVKSTIWEVNGSMKDGDSSNQLTVKTTYIDEVYDNDEKFDAIRSVEAGLKKR